MPPRHRKRDTDPLVRMRNMLEAEGRPAMAGLSRVGFGGGIPRAVTGSVLQPEADADSSGVGELIRLTASADSLAAGGDYLTHDTVERRVGFDEGGTSTSSTTLPRTGLYVVELWFAWADYTGGGTVEIEINGTVRRTHPDSGGGDRFDWTAMIDATAGDTLRIKVTHSEASAKVAAWDLTVGSVEPVGSDDRGPSSFAAETVFGFDAEHGGTSSVTITGSSVDMEVGDLLVAFVLSEEPTMTTPAAFTTLGTYGSGDEKYLIQTRTVQSGDDASSWTWTANGGGSPGKALAVLIHNAGAVSIDGTPDHDQTTTAGTVTLSTTTTQPTGRLLAAGKTTSGSLAASGMTALLTTTAVDNQGRTQSYALFSLDVAAESHNQVVSSSGAYVAALLAGVG